MRENLLRDKMAKESRKCRTNVGNLALGRGSALLPLRCFRILQGKVGDEPCRKGISDRCPVTISYSGNLVPPTSN